MPGDLRIRDVAAGDYFTPDELGDADRYELFHRVNWLLSTAVLLAVLGVYAVRGARFMRESAAGPIGTGMLLAMLGFGLVWLVNIPFLVAGNWWDRRHDVSKVDYVELVLRGVGVESDLTAVGALLAQARTAIDHYAPRDARLELADRFTAGLVRLLKGADPASDHQLAFARALALAVRDEVPVFYTDARNRQATKQALITVVTLAMSRMQ